MKTLLKIIIGLVSLLAILYGVAYFTFNKPLPKGSSGAEADAFAKKMLTAVNSTAWDTTAVVKWTFKGIHDYVWDKKNNLVEVKWDKNRVLLNLNEWEKSKAFEADLEHVGDKRGSLLGKAYAYFCNDSFWLIAPLKVKEEGVTRSLVTDEQGVKSLLITFASGGVTPGDSYQWFVDESGLPTHYNMWVSIIPIGGVGASWEAWQTTTTGVKLPASHKLGPLALEMGNVATAHSLEGLKMPASLFDAIK